ncbi:hypothetical protein NH26_19745 [Flammeovirga pacifica]|uniref:Esterase n=2 Tax=Flammeovirga pacifica TaxID=915059 RepID=A0A1S1YS38_FLAPC|nr:hypothetical protein NH26_19745 [Flammeovirga pacifica]
MLSHLISNGQDFSYSKKEVVEHFGTIDIYHKVASKYIPEREVRVWLPKHYNGEDSFGVLYMHDGQKVFIDDWAPWGKGWHVAQSMDSLYQLNQIDNYIIVAVDCTDERRKEYAASKPNPTLDSCAVGDKKSYIGSPIGDQYLQFLVKELKPFIDKNYKVYTDQKHTFIGGSSMGGVISMFGICEYPKVFHGAMCFSTHWPFDEGAFIDQYLGKHLPKAKNHLIYMDRGDQTLDQYYPPYQNKVDAIFDQSKYQKGVNYKTEVYPGHAHFEPYWRTRFPDVAKWMLSK